MNRGAFINFFLKGLELFWQIMDKCIIVWKKLCEYIEKEIARTNLKESKLFSGTDADPELAKKGDACVGWFIKPIAFFSLNVVIAVVVACTPYFELS